MNSRLTRILLALEPGSSGPLSLDTVAGLGLGTAIRLQTVFFEDQSLIQCAELSCSRILSRIAPAPRTPDRVALEQQIRRQREQMRDFFRTSAGNVASEYQFRDVRGQTGTELLREVSDCDVLVLTRSGAIAGLPRWMGLPLEQLLGAAPLTTVLVQGRWREHGSVMVLQDDSEASLAALRTAARIAARASVNMIELQTGDPGEAYAATVKGEFRLSYRLPALDISKVIALVRKHGAASLVLPVGLGTRYPGLVPSVLGGCQCSVVICR